MLITRDTVVYASGMEADVYCTLPVLDVRRIWAALQAPPNVPIRKTCHNVEYRVCYRYSGCE